MLKMLTGFVAKVLRLGAVESETLPDAGFNGGVCREQYRAETSGDGWKSEWIEDGRLTDSCMLDWLNHRSKGLVAFRWSTTNRGWRLMEVPADYLGSFQVASRQSIPPSRDVRKAISDFMSESQLPTDTEMLDWLDWQSGSYTGQVIWRMSESGHGWRLHETSRDGAKTTVRAAISCAIQGELTVTDPLAASAAQPSRMYRITQRGPKAFECALLAQGGFERWKKATLEAAVKSVIRGATAINHASITRDNISIQLKDDEELKVRLSDDASVNAALCLKCGGLAISWSRHECDCGLIAVDDDRDCGRRGSMNDIGEVPTRGMLENLAALPAKDRVAEWRHQSS